MQTMAFHDVVSIRFTKPRMLEASPIAVTGMTITHKDYKGNEHQTLIDFYGKTIPDLVVEQSEVEP